MQVSPGPRASHWEWRHLKDQVEILICQEKLQKSVQKTEPYKRQKRDEKEKKLEMGGNKTPIGEIMMISRGLVVEGSFKYLKKAYAKEVNNVHSWFRPLKIPRYNEPYIVFSEKDTRDIRQPYDDPLVIIFRMEDALGTDK